MANMQPGRTAADGAVRVDRLDNDEGFLVVVEHNGVTNAITMSGYNAWRVIALLAAMTDLNLPSNVTKRIAL